MPSEKEIEEQLQGIPQNWNYRDLAIAYLSMKAERDKYKDELESYQKMYDGCPYNPNP